MTADSSFTGVKAWPLRVSYFPHFRGGEQGALLQGRDRHWFLSVLLLLFCVYGEEQSNSWEGETHWHLRKSDFEEREKSKLLCTIGEPTIYISSYSLIQVWKSEENWDDWSSLMERVFENQWVDFPMVEKSITPNFNITGGTMYRVHMRRSSFIFFLGKVKLFR